MPKFLVGYGQIVAQQVLDREADHFVRLLLLIPLHSIVALQFLLRIPCRAGAGRWRWRDSDEELDDWGFALRKFVFGFCWFEFDRLKRRREFFERFGRDFEEIGSGDRLSFSSGRLSIRVLLLLTSADLDRTCVVS